jgi:hypothetical protein
MAIALTPAHSLASGAQAAARAVEWAARHRRKDASIGLPYTLFDNRIKWLAISKGSLPAGVGRGWQRHGWKERQPGSTRSDESGVLGVGPLQRTWISFSVSRRSPDLSRAV